jgi:uncharacterized protein (DUF305 family)
MIYKIKMLPIFAFSFAFLFACNSTSTESSADTTVVSTEDHAHDTDSSDHHSHDSMAIGTDLMNAMSASMSKMQSIKMTGDFDIDFATMMIEHHQGALDMSQIELAQGKDETIKSKAQAIIAAQKEEQQKLKDFISSYKPSGMKHGEGELQKSTQTMPDKMKSMQMHASVDAAFATMMISHHEEAISMAKMEVKNGMSDKLKQMAQKVITDQQKEIKEFQSWLSSHQ